MGCDRHRMILHRVIGETPMTVIRNSQKAVFPWH
jgi:predicted transcriptional regulator